MDVPPSDLAITVDPSKGKPGDVVSIGAPCDEGLQLTGATSEALKIGEWGIVGGDPGGTPHWFAEATVKNVKSGDYALTARCGDVKVSTTFTVVGGTEPVKNEQVPVKPKGAADTGSLDSSAKAAPANEESGNSALLIGAGVALAAAAAGGAGLVVYRRRHQN